MNIYRHMNRQSRTGGDWSEHSDAVLALIEQALSKTTRREQAIVLGVGNGRDLPLQLLVEQFEHVLLVDVDEVVLKRVANSLHDIKAGRAQWLAVELTGFHQWVESQTLSPPEDTLRAAWEARSRPTNEGRPLAAWCGRSDLVISVGIATQLLVPVLEEKWGPEMRPEWRWVVDEAARDHGRLVRDLCAPEGIAAVATEVWTSEGVASKDQGAFRDLLAFSDEDESSVWSQISRRFPEARILSGLALGMASEESERQWEWPWFFTDSRLYVMHGWIMHP